MFGVLDQLAVLGAVVGARRELPADAQGAAGLGDVTAGNAGDLFGAALRERPGVARGARGRVAEIGHPGLGRRLGGAAGDGARSFCARRPVRAGRAAGATGAFFEHRDGAAPRSQEEGEDSGTPGQSWVTHLPTLAEDAGEPGSEIVGSRCELGHVPGSRVSGPCGASCGSDGAVIAAYLLLGLCRRK